VRVETREVAHDDGHGQCDCQHTGKRAQSSDEHPVESFWRHVTVAHRRHRHQSPPQAERYALELVVGIILFVVYEPKEKANERKERERRKKVINLLILHKTFSAHFQ
jgi:hypothetical protein